MQLTLTFHDERIEAPAFADRVARSTQALHAAGIGDDDVVALLMRNHPLAIELMLATRALGARWCPVNWHYRADEVQYILDNSSAKLLVVDADLLAALPGLDLSRLQVFTSRGSAPGVESWAARRDALPPYAGAAHAPRGAMFYTSGTTGRPKGILRAPSTPEQVALAQEMTRRVRGFAPGMRALLSAPLYHSAPNTFAVGAAMDDGSELILEERFDAERTLQLVERHRITHAYLVPTMYVRLLALPPEVRARYDLSSVQHVSSTGSPCPPDVKRRMIEWWGPVITEAYGASELGYMTVLTAEQALRKPGSAGLPLPGVRIAIRDEQGRLLPRNQAGLIYTRQPAYADFTYVGNDEARRRMEIDGLLTMGDVGYLDDDGFLFIVDRAADMVISGGVNIYPAEIEAVLHTMPGVADCAVFGIPDDEFGESLAAVVQLRDGVEPDAEAVKAFLRERLAGYKVPRLVTFRRDLPREDTGKIFKRKLREPYWAGRTRRV